MEQERGREDVRILAEVGGQLQAERKAARDGHGNRYCRGSQSRPRRVHSGIARGGQAQGRGTDGRGCENHGRGFENLRKASSAFGDEPLGFVVSFRGNLESIANQIRNILIEPVAELLQARLVDARAFVRFQDIAGFDKFFQVTSNINGLDGDAGAAQERDGLAECVGHLQIAFGDGFGRGERKLLRAGHGFSHRFPERNHVRGRVRIQAESVEALGEGKHAFGGQKIVSGLESGDATEGCRADHRAAGLFADREGHHARGYCRSGAAGAASGGMVQIARVSRGAGSAVGEGGGYRFAQKNGAAATQVANDGGVRGADAALVKRRAIFGGHALRLDDVFHAEGDFGERAVGGGPFGLNDDPGVDGGVEFADAVEALLQSALTGFAIGGDPVGEGFQA